MTKAKLQEVPQDQDQNQAEIEGITPAPAAAKRAETAIATVKMDDGRVLDFPGKRRQLKTTSVNADGQIVLHMDYVNGECRQFTMHPDLVLDYAAHGMMQKYGDKFTDEKDLDDAVNGVDQLHERLGSGRWEDVSEAKGSGAGGSILVRAMVEASAGKKSKEQISAFLAAKTKEYKELLKKHKDIAPIIARLEAEKASKNAEKNPQLHSNLADEVGDFLA